MSRVYKYCINGIEFELGEKTNIDFLCDYGKVLKVYDKNDSGNISFIVESEQKYFLKVAGLKTCNSTVEKSAAIANLRYAKDVYSRIKYKRIVQPISYQEKDGLALFLFPFVEGECLFDHWNFEYYKEHNILSPLCKFLLLNHNIKKRFVESLFAFYESVNAAGYIATDFYEGSILYNFSNNEYYFCDLDFFSKESSINLSGFQWGPERFLAPEEKSKGCLLDIRTDIYHLGVFIRIIFTDYETKSWTLSDEKLSVVQKATEAEPSKRFSNFKEFEREWSNAI